MTIREAVRNNWYLLVALIVLVVVIVGRAATRDTEPAETPAATGPVKPAAGAAPPAEAPAIAAKRFTPSERALATIQQHQSEIELDPKGEKAPSLLLSIGNLYMQKLQDYEQAIDSYERIIAEHPQWDAIQKAYMQLAIAYEKSGNIEKAKSVYEEMMKRFPEDSVEHTFAKKQLSEL